MKNLSFDQMMISKGGKVECNISEEAQDVIDWIALVASIGSCFGVPGLVICGPTALGLAIVNVIC